MISRNYSEKISFITFFPLFTNIFTNAPGLTLNSDKSDSNQCYSVSESATARCSHSTVVSQIHNLNALQFNHKTYQ